MGKGSSISVDVLRQALDNNFAKNGGNIWSNFLWALGSLIDQIEADRKVLSLTNQAPEEVMVEDATKLLDDFVNNFRKEFFRWCLRHQEKCWQSSLRYLDNAINSYLTPEVLGNLTDYMQWRRRNKGIDETKQGISPSSSALGSKQQQVYYRA